MLDIGWSEFAVIALVALLVVGPRDLPGVLRTAGRWVRRVRGMAQEFQSSLEEMTRDADLDEAREQFRSIKSFDLKAEAEKAVDPDGSLRDDFDPDLDAVFDDHAEKFSSDSGSKAPKLEKQAQSAASPGNISDTMGGDGASTKQAKTGEAESTGP